MKTAKDFAKASQVIGRMAQEMKPADTDPYAQAMKLVQFHLQSAARISREIAEARAAKEGQTA